MNAIVNHDEDALDEALGMTFPASDPIAVYLKTASGAHESAEAARRPGPPCETGEAGGMDV